jgi:hypothetical protein
MSLFKPKAARTAPPHRPVAPGARAGTPTGSWIIESGGTSGGGAGIPGEAPAVTIGTPTVIPRETDTVEVDVPYTPNSAATSTTYSGVAVFIEDPDISSGTEAPLDGSMPLDGSAQVSGQWNPQRDQNASKSPVAVLIPEGDVDRSVRIYLAAFGPNSTAQLVRANDTTKTPTPSAVVTIPAVSNTYTSGMEVAWLVTDAGVTVNTEYNLAPPLYTLTFSYLPPSPEKEAHRPPGLSPFGGVAIWYKYFDDGRLVQAMQHPYVATAAKVGQVESWKSTEYEAGKGSFRVYFVSVDVGGNQNSIVDGITPSVDVTIDPTTPVPKVTMLQIVPGSAGVQYLLDGSFVDMVTFSWTLPATGIARYAGLFLYRVATNGTAPVPAQIRPQTAATDTQALVEISNVPTTPETWTIAAIAVDFNGQLEDDPTTYGSASWTSPVVAWTVGPPGFGVTGGGQEYAPLVTVNAGATAAPTESTSSDGVRMVTFAINGTNGAWTNPTDNRFGGVWVALVVNGDVSHPIFWQVPQGANKFTTPAIAAPGSFGQAIPLAFYLLSRDPQGHRNTLVVGVTPAILLSYTPTEGVIIPSRNPLTPQWFSSEFNWDKVTFDMTVSAIGAGKIQVGSILQVGGKNSFNTGAAQNGQIGVFNSGSQLVGWIGTAVFDGSLQQTTGAGNYGGAWFGQLWVGGDSPAHAPLWINQEGVIVVGGIAAQQGSQYPYISIRDYYGIERGRIGAMLTNPAPPGDSGSVPSSSLPTQLTSGAWFTQFAAGGASSGNWQVLIDGSQTPGKFYIRDTDQFSINFAANPNDGSHSAPFNPPYTISMGKSVWAGVASAGNTWQFPGIQIYEAGGNPPSQIFGAVLLNRGLVLRGTPAQGNSVIASLVMFNGDNLGSDQPPWFWGGLAMYSPTHPSQVTVNLTSGSTDPTYGGDATFYLFDHNGIQNFGVAGNGDVEFRGALRQGTKLLVDTNGNWQGGGASAVTSVGAGTGISVNPATGAVIVTNTGVTQVVGGKGVSVSSFTGSSTISIGQDVQATSNVTFNQITSYYYNAYNTGKVAIDQNGKFMGPEVDISPVGNEDAIHVNGLKCCDYNGIWSGNGVQANASIFGSQFGIFGVATGVTGTFTSANGKTVTVNGGIITGIA